MNANKTVPTVGYLGLALLSWAVVGRLFQIAVLNLGESIPIVVGSTALGMAYLYMGSSFFRRAMNG